MSKLSTTRQTLSIFWQYNRAYPLLFWAGTIGSALGVIAQGIIPPLVVARTFAKLQQAYSAHTALTFSMFTPYFLLFMLAMLIGVALWRIQSYCVWELETKVKRDMAIAIHNHLQHQSQRFHADRFGGALVSQTNKFMGSYERMMDDFIWNIVSGATTLVVSLGVLVFISFRYSLVLALITVIYLVVMARRMRTQMPYNVAQAEKETEQTAALADAITNVSTVRAFSAEEYEHKRFSGIAGVLHQAYHTLSIEVLKTEALSHIQTNGFSIIAFLFGLLAITRFGANVSVLYLILTYTQGLTGQLWQFGRIIRNVNRSFGDAAEMTHILQITPEVKDPPGPQPFGAHRGGITFENVTFFYPENEHEPLFQNLSLQVKPGEKIGLVGHSGGGKTTFTKLLLRFMDIQGGRILIDDQDITRSTQAAVRHKISYVPQEPMLFHRSLRENIRYGRRDASEDEVTAVAKMAHAHEFIEKLPHGYETLVGERGVKLSGGQRQRIAIARAMLKNAPILLLDEATSALDSESEQLIQDALWKLMEGRTALVIAHRLSTIQKMDRIIVLKAGKIVEQGSHKELLRQKGTYAELWAHQSGGFIDE